MEVNTICICGAGTMGSGIAQVAAQSGYYTLLYEVNDTVLEKARKGIEKTLTSLVEKEKIKPAERAEILSRLRFTSDLQECLADVFIEAIIENPGIKIGLFNQLAEINHSETVFATNTSSLSITSLAEKIKNPERVIGFHFFNPAPVMKLVEIVKTKYTSDQVVSTIAELAKNFNKTAVHCIDAPGFIVNHVARPYYIESLRLIEDGLSDYEQIDRLMEASGFKMGPFKLMDLIGNDVNYAVSCSVYDQLSKPERLKPSHLQEGKVSKGELGKKTGKGYFEY